jgi:hypothetical protein
MAGPATESLGGAHRRDTTHLQTQAHLALKMLMCRLHEVRRPQAALVADRELARLVATVDASHDPYALHDRLRAWQSLHPMHGDLALWSPEGRLLARLGGALPQVMAPVADADWWQATLADGHAEHWGPNALHNDHPATVLHAHRLSDAQGHVLGVLCLTIDLVPMARAIFRNLMGPHEAGLLAVVDAQGRVMVSSDVHLLPEGQVLGSGQPGAADGEVIELPDGPWLSARSGFWRHTDGPAFGPGWMGHALQPLAGRTVRPATWATTSRTRRREGGAAAVWATSVTVSGALLPLGA